MAKKLHGSSKLLDKEVVTAKNSAIKGRFVLNFSTYFVSFRYLYFLSNCGY